MKYLLILFTLFSPILNASDLIKWETDYYPDFGRVSITWIDQDKVVIEEDKNNCMYNNFGVITACTLMATIESIDSLILIGQDETNNLYQFLNIKHLRLVTDYDSKRILKIDQETGNVVLSLRLNPRIISLPEYLRIKELNL